MSSTERTRGSKERTIWPVLPGLIMDPEFVEGVDVFRSLFNCNYWTACQGDCFEFGLLNTGTGSSCLTCPLCPKNRLRQNST